MKLKYLLPLIIPLLLAQGCSKKEDKRITEPPDGWIGISELQTKHDYYLPFALKNDTNTIASITLNGESVNFTSGDYIGFNENGFYELIVKYKDAQQPNDTFLFTTKTEEREFSEWGIRAWTPAHYKTVSLGSEDVEVIYPHRYADSIKVPFIFYVKVSGITEAVYCRGTCPATDDTFNIKQGVGSVNIPASSISSHVKFLTGGKDVTASISKISEAPVELKGSITSAVELPANSFVRITGDLDITSTGSLTVDEGTLIIADEAVNINVSGPVVFSGTSGNPVFVTCSSKDRFWGGFITRVPAGTITAAYTIFCQSGYHDTDGYGWGHAGRQALFYTENSTLTLNHCFMLDHIGQVFYPQFATLKFDDILVQRVKTGGQINYSDLVLRNSVFTDFPVESDVFLDLDNDALYLNGTDATIENTKFMFAKDDGLDSGASDGGDVTVTNCRFEACFHEGAALSSAGTVIKHHTFTGCTFINCGQGLELGYSSPNHTVVADNCKFLNNGIGIRYGDNYDWAEVNGKMTIKNSESLDNDRDVWNMVRMIWSPRIANLSFENTVVSKLCPQYPGLPVKN
jgi:hypothetical protein